MFFPFCKQYGGGEGGFECSAEGFTYSPEPPDPVPSPGQVTALAALLAVYVAGQQMLHGQRVADRPFAHDTEPVVGHLDRGYGPRRTAPSLVDRLRNVLSPYAADVVRPRQ